MSNIALQHFDSWFAAGSPSALVVKEHLEPAAGKGAVIFPPTFAQEEGSKEKGGRYIVDGEGDTSTCLLDTVGSQANRLEPVFLEAELRSLVPQVSVRVQSREISILELGHRAADAVIRSTALAQELRSAFAAFATGNAEPLAKVAPTSLVFGAWDSRDTQTKLPRLIDSTIRAYNVAELKRGAQFFGGLEKSEIAEFDLGADNDALSKAGFLDAPAGVTHGGIAVKGNILRTTILNLTALRAIGGTSPEATEKLRRYILGLALVAAFHPSDLFLRQGCLLVRDRDAEKPISCELVFRDGKREATAIDFETVKSFAIQAASAFGVGESKSVPFDPAAAKASLAKPEDKKPKKGK